MSAGRGLECLYTNHLVSGEMQRYNHYMITASWSLNLYTKLNTKISPLIITLVLLVHSEGVFFCFVFFFFCAPFMSLGPRTMSRLKEVSLFQRYVSLHSSVLHLICFFFVCVLYTHLQPDMLDTHIHVHESKHTVNHHSHSTHIPAKKFKFEYSHVRELERH